MKGRLSYFEIKEIEISLRVRRTPVMSS